MPHLGFSLPIAWHGGLNENYPLKAHVAPAGGKIWGRLWDV